MQKYKMPIRLRIMVCLIGMLLPMCMFAQQITVQGVVKDQTGETVIGASVMEKGTTNGTITGIDGDFSLNMSPNGTLVVSFVGYKTQEVQVKGQKQLQVVLSEDAEMLDEVVVIGYGTMKKSDLTGAVSSIGNKDIKDSPVSNLGQAIQGKISGVQIVDAGKPGDNVSIKIRGLGSINNCDPLVVIDGVPTDLGLSSLNMADVERLDVLKDASATAIYGSRGANGVVMITTKRGTEGKGKLAVSANYSFQNATNVPSLLNAAQYAELSNDMMVNSGRNPNPEWANPSELGAGTDWMDELLRTGVMQNYTVSYSGGNEKSHYYVSGGFLDQSGTVRSVNYRRFTFQSNSDAQVLKWLKFSNNITFSADTKKSGSYNIGDALKALPIYPVKNEDGSWSGPDGNSEWYGSTRNPIGPTELNKSQTDGYNFLANLTAELTFTKWLKFKSTFGYDAKFWFIDNFTPKYNWKPTPTEETSRYKSDNKSFTYLWDNYFLFDHTFAEKHRVGLMAGMSAQWNTNDYLNAQKNVFMFDNVHEMDNGEEMYAIGGNETEWALLSYMARVNYSYEDRYLLTATIRRDGSSRFGKENKWGTFPSAAFAWRVNQESFLRDVSWIDNLKLRVSYGIVGNQNGIGNYTTLGLADNKGYEFGDVFQMGYLPGKELSNPNLKWEQSATANFGVDFSFFNGRLNGTVEYYNTHTKDLLVKRSLNASLGYTTMLDNLGKTKSSGIDLSLNGDVVRTKEFTWTLGTNFSMYKNEIVRIDDTLDENGKPASQVAQGWIIGEPINVYYDYLVDGIFQYDDFDITRDGTGNLVYTLKNTYDSNSDGVADSPIDYGGAIEPGMVKVRDNNGDGRITADDRVPIRKDPKFTVSLSSTWNWKGFDLFMDWYGVSGRKIKNGYLYEYNSGGSLRGKLNGVKVDYWTPFNPSNEFPRPSYSADPAYLSAIAIQDASYIRLRTLQLGYTFPTRLLKNTPIHKLRLYATATNLLTFTEFKSYSPELTPGSYPESRQYVFGVNVSF